MLNDLLFAIFAGLLILCAMPWIAKFSFWLATEWTQCIRGICHQYFGGK